MGVCVVNIVFICFMCIFLIFLHIVMDIGIALFLLHMVTNGNKWH